MRKTIYIMFALLVAGLLLYGCTTNSAEKAKSELDLPELTELDSVLSDVNNASDIDLGVTTVNDAAAKANIVPKITK